MDNKVKEYIEKQKSPQKEIIQEVRILIEIPDETDIFKWGYNFLKDNLAQAIDWEQGDCYPENEAPLQ